MTSTTRADEQNHALARMSEIFMTEKERTELLGWILKALGSKRFSQKVSGHHTAQVVEHAWIFQFIDIIYVATFFKLSHLISQCGRGTDVYVLCFAYFCIMFSTRTAFDTYTSVSGASGVLHLIACCFYGIGVFIMTVNISAKSDELPESHARAQFEMLAAGFDSTAISSDVAINTQVHYGTCSRTVDYDVGFATAFIFTRMVLVIMYGLYFFVFHESNVLGHAPDLTTSSGRDIRLSDLTRESDLEAAMRIGPPSMSHPQLQAQSHSRPTSVRSAPSLDETSNESRNTSLSLSHDIQNPMMRLTTVQRPSVVMKAAHAFRESVVQKHFLRIFLLKVVPVLISSLAIILMFLGASPVYVLPVVAFIEFVGDFLPSYFINNPADWRELNPQRHFTEERLGLFFMLVLGEAVLGLCSTDYTSSNMSKVYRVLLFSFFTIFTIGMQYFEPLQSYTKPEGPHPLDVQKLSPVYVWLVCFASFFMLVAAQGMVQLYGDLAYNKTEHLDNRDLLYAKQKVANGLGSVTLIIIAIKMLDKLYYRERLLPTSMYNWLQKFYEQTEEEEARHRQTVGNLAAVAADLRTSTISAAADGFNDRASFRVVAKADVAVGIRKIRPIVRVKVLAAVAMFAIWHISIPTEDYMTYNAGLVVLPSLLEVCLEVRNFLKQQRELRQMSVQTPGMEMNHIAGGNV